MKPIDPFQPDQIQRLVREFGSPLLIIDCARVRAQFRKLRQALPGVDLHYALKPLPHAAVVRVIVQERGWLDLATSGEVQLVRALGVAPERCIHTHPIKRERDIRNALAFGVRTFVADNPDEVRKFKRYGDRVALLLRISFRSPGAVCDLSRKFGCDPEDAIGLARLAASLGINVGGFSFHVGSRRRRTHSNMSRRSELARSCSAAPDASGSAASIHSISAGDFQLTTCSAQSTSSVFARRFVQRSRSCRAGCA